MPQTVPNSFVLFSCLPVGHCYLSQSRLLSYLFYTVYRNYLSNNFILDLEEVKNTTAVQVGEVQLVIHVELWFTWDVESGQIWNTCGYTAWEKEIRVTLESLRARILEFDWNPPFLNFVLWINHLMSRSSVIPSEGSFDTTWKNFEGVP